MFITFEGIEGSAKTTQANMLCEHLDKIKIPYVLTKEPGSDKIGLCQNIREMILNPENEMCGTTELFLYLADRAEHVDKCIVPSLRKNKWVVCDRYIDSTIVYQGVGRGLGIDKIKNMILFSSNNVIPDLTILLDLPAEIGLRRARKSNKEFSGGDRIEKEGIEFHNKLRRGFLSIASGDNRFVVIDATQDKKQMHKEIIRSMRFKFA